MQTKNDIIQKSLFKLLQWLGGSRTKVGRFCVDALTRKDNTHNSPGTFQIRSLHLTQHSLKPTDSGLSCF